ncbi:MAG TPA: hypothetical protein VK457_15270 [Chloroflexota bacterium]|nr:hypothetical protein [Chloroflexota bacterium]
MGWGIRGGSDVLQPAAQQGAEHIRWLRFQCWKEFWDEGRPITADELEQAPEGLKLAQFREGIAKTEGELGGFVRKFNEGGGASMYKAGMDITGGELEQRIAGAFEIDEVGHMKTGAEGLRRVVKTDEQWDKAKGMTREIARPRVRMRNEMFGHPLSEERLREIDEGKIEPFHRDILARR